MPNIAVTFMDNSISYFHTGDGPADYYSWKIDNTGLVFSRHTKGERTHIPWYNIKYFDVEIPGAPLREQSSMQTAVKYLKYGQGQMQVPSDRCKAGRVVRPNLYSAEEEVRCFKPEGHYNVTPGQVRSTHSSVTVNGKYEVRWLNGQEAPEIKELRTNE